MRVIDSDAHFHEPVDWLNQADPELAAELPPPPTFGGAFVKAAGGVAQQTFPPEVIPDNPVELVAAEFRVHLMKAEAMQPERYERDSGNPYYDPAARIKLLDEEGIDVQFINPTMSIVQGFLQVVDSGHPEKLPRLIGAYNRWAAEQVAGYTDRLVPVTEIFPHDVPAIIAEMTRMREAGSLVFHLTQNDLRSYTHPDYEPMWSAAEDLGMLAYVHLPFGDPVHRSLANNGRGFETYVHLGGLAEAPRTRQFLMAMVFDGVFARHPRLRMLLAECGHSWLPQFLFDIDAKTTKIAMDGTPQENFYQLPLKPSEYIRRHVRVSVVPGFVEAGVERLSVADALRAVPDPEMLIFSSDYPHVEGRVSGVPFFEKLLPPDEAVRESFFGRSIAEFAGL
jgi:predicted TIM-barrel fold metal-dependent hydrolase